jgi:two-component system, NarL family, response regulator DesR
MSLGHGEETVGGTAVIRVVVALGESLMRGALAALLAREEDIEVIAELADAHEVLRAGSKHHPEVAVLDTDLLEPEEQAAAQPLYDAAPGTRLLLLVDVHKASSVGRVQSGRVPEVGYVAKDASPAMLVEAIRQLAQGAVVFDPRVAVAALRAVQNPLTPREREILAIVAQGESVKEIADRLYLSVGTIRNTISRILAKTGARSRVEAIKIAQDAGWL